MLPQLKYMCKDASPASDPKLVLADIIINRAYINKKYIQIALTLFVYADLEDWESSGTS